uniref:Uncharacterized protein n=1 Tax=Rhizophora mucronata TaxID=61149 RepID=A0A2P2Q2F6_RHIMU
MSMCKFNKIVCVSPNPFINVLKSLLNSEVEIYHNSYSSLTIFTYRGKDVKNFWWGLHNTC